MAHIETDTGIEKLKTPYSKLYWRYRQGWSASDILTRG